MSRNCMWCRSICGQWISYQDGGYGYPNSQNEEDRYCGNRSAANGRVKWIVRKWTLRRLKQLLRLVSVSTRAFRQLLFDTVDSNVQFSCTVFRKDIIGKTFVVVSYYALFHWVLKKKQLAVLTHEKHKGSQKRGQHVKSRMIIAMTVHPSELATGLVVTSRWQCWHITRIFLLKHCDENIHCVLRWSINRSDIARQSTPLSVNCVTLLMLTLCSSFDAAHHLCCSMYQMAVARSHWDCPRRV